MSSQQIRPRRVGRPPRADQVSHAVSCGPVLPLGLAIRLGRLHSGVRRQSRLADELRWPVRLINEFEVGHRRPTPEQLAVLRTRLPLLDLLLNLGRPEPAEVDMAVRR